MPEHRTGREVRTYIVCENAMSILYFREHAMERPIQFKLELTQISSNQSMVLTLNIFNLYNIHPTSDIGLIMASMLYEHAHLP